MAAGLSFNGLNCPPPEPLALRLGWISHQGSNPIRLVFRRGPEPHSHGDLSRASAP